MIVTSSGSSGAEVRKLTIDGAGHASYGILINESEWVTVDDVEINNFGSIPVGILDSYHVYFWNSRLGPDFSPSPSVSPHIWIDGSDAIWIADNQFDGKPRTSTHEGDGGIAMYGSSNLLIYDNFMHRAGIYVASQNGTTPSHDVAIWGNEFSHANEWPVDIVEGSHDIKVLSNSMYNSFHGAIVVWNSFNIEIAHNVMTNNNTGGHVPCQAINVISSSNLIINNNTASPLPVVCYN